MLGCPPPSAVWGPSRCKIVGSVKKRETDENRKLNLVTLSQALRDGISNWILIQLANTSAPTESKSFPRHDQRQNEPEAFDRGAVRLIYLRCRIFKISCRAMKERFFFPNTSNPLSAYIVESVGRSEITLTHQDGRTTNDNLYARDGEEDGLDAMIDQPIISRKGKPEGKYVLEN